MTEKALIVASLLAAFFILWFLKTCVWLLIHKLMYGTWRDYP